jgi:hypothetical protein
MENMNPISDKDGGEDYVRPANMMVAGEEPPEPPEPAPAEPPAEDELGKAIRRLQSVARV